MTQTPLRTCHILALFAAILMICGNQSAVAQDVVGVSEILSSTSSSEIDTYSATELSYAASLYYGAYVEGYLYDNSNLIGAGSAQDQQLAYGYMSKPLTVGDVYTIESDHYLIAAYAYSSGGTSYFYNPSYFNFGDGSTDPSGSSFSPGGGSYYVVQQYIYLGTTAVQVSSAQPSINSIDHNTGTIGKSGTIAVHGDNLLDPFTGQASPSITGSGVTLSPTSSSTSQEVDLNYSIDQGATAGDRSLTLSNRFGTSNAARFTVGYPAAIVTSLNPPSWQAGQNFTLTVNGTGFGTAPTVNISGAAGVQNGLATNTNPQGTQTQVPVTVQANAPTGTATVTVTPGYTGSGFYCGNCNGSPNGTDTAPVQQNLPAPTITIQNGGTNTPFAGQSVSLSVSAPGFTIDHQTWSFGNNSDVVAGWNASAASGCYVSVTGTGTGSCTGQSLNLTQTQLGNFYFIVPGQQESVYVDAYYKMADGSTSPAQRATLTFSVQGPTGNLRPNGYVQTNDTATVLGNPTGNPASLKMSNAPTDPNVSFNPIVGVRLDDLATLPRGSLMWVQILNTVNYLQIAPPNSQFTPPSNATAQLDGVYPYPSASSNTTNDSPSRKDLLAGLGEAAISFDATMYALWDPAIPPTGQTSCTPATTNPSTYTSTASTCASIPVPLGSIEWKWTPCAINTIPPPPAATGPSWVLKCGPGFINSGTASGYPTWKSCHTSGLGKC
jgi:hypothetical protein